MADNTTLSTRMKENYENRTKQYLMRRTPTIIRLDGKAWHTYCKGLDRPFDDGLREDMQATTAFLCSEIQGAKCGYTQSDEITILLTDYDSLTTDAWFNYSVQKMCSIAASLATAKFNELRVRRIVEGNLLNDNPNAQQIKNVLGHLKKSSKLAFFDARVFQIADKEEVVNCFLWRQRDAEKNSISMLAQSLYSHKELHQKNTSDMQEMCFQKGHNWNDLHFSKKRGSFIINNTYVDGSLMTDGTTVNDKSVIRNKWKVVETPFFGKDRNSILKYLKYE